MITLYISFIGLILVFKQIPHALGSVATAGDAGLVSVPGSGPATVRAMICSVTAEIVA